MFTTGDTLILVTEELFIRAGETVCWTRAAAGVTVLATFTTADVKLRRTELAYRAVQNTFPAK